jgi:shikimate kinase
MKETVVDNSIKHHPLLIELVGPAGAGKTTLSRALSQQSEKIEVGAEIELRKIRQIPVFVRNALFLLPFILWRSPYSRWFTWEEIKALVYLKGWTRVLKEQAKQNGKAILLDHGPVFKLATLHEFGPEILKSERFDLWWNQMFGQWASTVDIVIWLDAPDKILEERINSRKQRHAVKGKSESHVSLFLARYRLSYEEILTKLKTYGKPILFRFDTSQTPIEKIVDDLLIICKSC